VRVPDQIADLQLFQIDGVVAAQQRERALMVKVAPLPLHLLVLALQEANRLAAPVAAVRAPRQAALGLGKLTLCGAVVVR
jgi:hypothetical protein